MKHKKLLGTNTRRQYMDSEILHNERPRQSNAVLNRNGEVITGREAVKARWTEHFKEVLNRNSPENPITINEQCEERIEDISVNEPTLNEVKEAIKRLKNEKSPGIDSITAELLKPI